MIIRLLCMMILFLASPQKFLQAQTYFFEKLGPEQGFIGHSKVYSVLQDRGGLIWFGTETGVSRFNGSEFQDFSSADGLSGGGVMSIFEDSIGRIWFGHLYGGISIFDGTMFSRPRFDSLTIEGDISGIREFDKHVWISTSKSGVIRIEIPAPGDSILKGKQYRGKEGSGLVIANSCVDSNNNLYFVTDDAGIKKYNPVKDIFETFMPDSLQSYFSTTFMFEDSKGNFWYGTHNGGLYKYVKSTGTMKSYDKRDGLAHQWTSFITEDYRGNIWAGSWGGGITVFSGDRMMVYNKSNGLDATSIHCIYEDKEKNMIIADHSTGISVYKGDHFVTYSDDKLLPDKSVYAVGEDKSGNYWFGTNGGISVFNPSEISEKKVRFLSDETNITGNRIRFLKTDLNGNIWIGTEDRGLMMYDLAKNKVIYDFRISEYLSGNNYITALEIDKHNRVWIGNMDQLVVWDPAEEKVRLITENDGLPGSYISALYCDTEGNMWIGSESSPEMGLTKYLSSSDIFYKMDMGKGFVPKTIVQTPDKTIWVGTNGGLFAIRDNEVVDTLNYQDGLLSNYINLLVPQGKEYLYIGTNKGLNRISFADSTIATFTERNGFTGIETKPNASFCDSRGRIWFGTTNGVTMLDPAKMPPVCQIPLTHISSMTVKYQPRPMKEDLKLSYKENSLMFNFYSVCLVNPDAVKYRFMLKGADDGWSPPTNIPMKDFPSLSPGHYTFRVIASNGYGYWNETPSEYSFIIKPPFYLTPWFIITCLALVAIGVVVVVKVRERNLRHEKKILEQKVEERTAEVVQKSVEIEEKNRDITASIRYAERIQRAMLPGEDTFDETFILFMPKDIVSGDFYWMHDTGELQFLAACDCTGHGVPGAFMSIIGYNSLNKVVREYGITEPGPILDKLNDEIVSALMQRHEETIKDGMDMALISFDRKNFVMEFAGAYNPLYVVRKGEIFTYKSDRFPIGMSSQRAKKSFQTQIVDIRPGDMVYMASDGYADQFGALTAKKYKSGNVKKLLCQIWDLPVNEQKARLEKEILDWKGDYAQIDDILFIGTRVPEI